MTRKFLFCFPLRVGNIVFGYTVIIIAIAVMTYNLYCLGLSVVPEEQEVSQVNKSINGQEKFRNWENVEQLFGHEKNSLVTAISMIYFISYSVIAFLLLVFGAVFICGAYKANYCLVSTFFVYSFFHLFLTVGLIALEATSAGYIQLGLVLLSDAKQRQQATVYLVLVSFIFPVCVCAARRSLHSLNYPLIIPILAFILFVIIEQCTFTGQRAPYKPPIDTDYEDVRRETAG